MSNETKQTEAVVPQEEKREPEINISRWLSKGWDLVMANLGNFVLLTLIYLIVLLVASSATIGWFLVYGPLNVGFFYIIFNRMRGKPFSFGDLTRGFSYFLASVLAHILTSVFIGAGFIFFIVPGLILMAMYLFVYPLILEKNLDFWTAMENSRKVVSKHLFEIIIFVIIQLIILFLGFLFLGVGLLIAIPLVKAAIAYAYDDLVGLEKETQA